MNIKENNYFFLYCKYKKKYLNLKRNIGGSISNQELKNIFTSFLAPIKTQEDLELSKKNNVTNTYGTITPDGIKTLIDNLDISKDDSFIDLGSGIGNVVIQFAINTNVKKADGVEFLKSRIEKSKEYIEKFKEKYYNKINKISIKQDDIKNVNFDDYNIFFTCSTCFPNELMTIINDKAEKNINLKYLITQKKLSENTKLKLLKTIDLNCSWDSTCEHYIYTNIL
tara:strand:- start:495 stop:1169 length:675 start_codon:yes stop_codon:yes gene_type:complete